MNLKKRKHMNRFLAIFLFLFCFAANAQEKTGIAIDPSANNVAVLFTMTSEDGRIRNLELMESVFKDKTLGFRCERHHNVSSPFIYNKLTDTAKALDSDATLLLYFNSHGGGSGNGFIMTAQGGSFKFSKALEALGKSGRPIKRLIFLVDTCHAEGSIQDSLKQDGDLLRNIQMAKPTSFLPELPSSYSKEAMPFISIFTRTVYVEQISRGRKFFQTTYEVDYGEDSGVYEEILIISSSSVEDLSIRGAFASRFASTFKSVRDDRSVTVGGFLKKFALSHGSSGQQPHYKVLPDNRMFGELLFGPSPAQRIPILDHGGRGKFDMNFIPLPSK
jgi:hypothetical protein